MQRPSLQSAYIFGGTVIAAVLAVWSGCAKKTVAKHQMAPTAIAATTRTPVDTEKRHGSGTGKVGEIALYVDGKPTAIVRISELPLGLKQYARESATGGMTTAHFFRLYDYIAALGIDIAKIKTIHCYGSWGRVAAVDGDELVKYKEDLLFDFTGEDYGKPRMRWSTDHLRTPTNIDLFQAIAVYIDKKPPTYDEKLDAMVLDGKTVEGVPYVSEAVPKGTRFYLDGKLLGAAKRRHMSDKLLSKKDATHTKYSFAAYLNSFGVDLAKIKSVDFVNGDSLAYRATSKELESDAMTFTLWNQMHGKVEAVFPGEKFARVTSVQVFSKATPPSREADPDVLSDESELSAPKATGGDDGNGDGTGTGNSTNGDDDSAD